MTFTIGRGNDLCCAAIEQLAPLVVGRELEEIVADGAAFWRRLTNDGQLRWLGPEKGVIHLATAALVNAVWDLWARVEGKPLWRLVCDLSPEQFVASVDFRYLTDVLDRDEALDMLRALAPTRAERIAELERDGYPAYLTSAGWLGYDEATVRDLCRQALADGWRCFKTKVGLDVAGDVRRCEVMREEIGDLPLMADANQVWDVDEAIARMRHLAPFDLRWIEEPTSPDDVLGHAAIRRAIAPVGVATGEHAANRVVFKQLLQAEAIDYCQIDACRLGGVNEVLGRAVARGEVRRPGVRARRRPRAVRVRAASLCAIDYVCVSGSLDDRTTEFADHLHEHFVTPPSYATGATCSRPPRATRSTCFPTRTRRSRFPAVPRGERDERDDWSTRRPLGVGDRRSRRSDSAARRSAICSPVSPTTTRTRPSTRPGTPVSGTSTPRRSTGTARRSAVSAARCAPGRETTTSSRPRSVACCDRPGPLGLRPSSPTSAMSSPSSTSPTTGSCGRSRRAWRGSAPTASTWRSCTTPTTTRTTPCAHAFPTLLRLRDEGVVSRGRVRDEPGGDARAVRRACRPRLRPARGPLFAARSQRLRAARAVRGAGRRSHPRRRVQHRSAHRSRRASNLRLRGRDPERARAGATASGGVRLRTASRSGPPRSSTRCATRPSRRCWSAHDPPRRSTST